jgi:hypothetical protein
LCLRCGFSVFPLDPGDIPPVRSLLAAAPGPFVHRLGSDVRRLGEVPAAPAQDLHPEVREPIPGPPHSPAPPPACERLGRDPAPASATRAQQGRGVGDVITEFLGEGILRIHGGS